MPLIGYGKLFLRADEQLTEEVPTPQQFTRIVELLVSRYRLSYLDAIMALCDHHGREYDSVRKLLTPKLKLTLMGELAHRRLLKDKSYLQDKLG